MQKNNLFSAMSEIGCQCDQPVSVFGKSIMPNHVDTITGNGVYTYSGNAGPANSASLYGAQKTAVDSSGNLYLADWWGHIRFIPKATGTYFGQSMTKDYIYTIVGGTQVNYVDGVDANSTAMAGVYGLAVDSSGNIYLSSYHERVYMVPSSTTNHFGINMTAGHIYIIAGSGSTGYSGDNGNAKLAMFNCPNSIAVDAAGNVIVADIGNGRIRAIARNTSTYYGQSMTQGSIYTIAGDGGTTFSGDNVAANSSIPNLTRIAIDGAGNIFFPDGARIRVRTSSSISGNIFGYSAYTMQGDKLYTIAGDGAGGTSGDGNPVTDASTRVGNPTDLVFDDQDNLIFGDQGRVRFVPRECGVHFGQNMLANHVYTIAGGFLSGLGGDGDIATSAVFGNGTLTLSWGLGVLYVSDGNNVRVRAIPACP
jgi:hypothetical protein